MSKYQPLSDRLRGHAGDQWRASFSEIEEVLGFPLPKGARAGRAWWANAGDKSHVKAWTGEGFHAEVDQEAGAVTFRRSDISPAALEAAGALEPVGDLSGAPDLEVPAPPPPPYAMTPRPGAAPTRKRSFHLGGMVAAGVAVVALGALLFRRR